MVSTIEYLRFKRQYRYVWKKRVTGFDLSVHCARCLLGWYDTRISAGVAEYAGIGDIAEAGDTFYICAVWQYAENVHIAYRAAEGGAVEVHTPFVDCRIANAEALPISPEWIDWSLPHARAKAFHTCRNWQFANWLARQGK